MKLKDLKNKYENKMIFIVGSGSSLNAVDTNDLKDSIVMAVNGGILKVPFANMYVSDDIGVKNWSYFDIVKKSNCIKFFYDKKFSGKCDDLKNVCLYSHKSWFSPPDTYNLPDGLQLTKDIPIIGARTSFASALHISYILGFKTIILLGNDCQLSQDGKKYRYFFQYWNKDKQPYRLKGTTFNKQTQNQGFDNKAFIEYWEKFCEVNKNILKYELKIYDASNGALNCFEKIDIKDIKNIIGK